MTTDAPDLKALLATISNYKVWVWQQRTDDEVEFYRRYFNNAYAVENDLIALMRDREARDG